MAAASSPASSGGRGKGELHRDPKRSRTRSLGSLVRADKDRTRKLLARYQRSVCAPQCLDVLHMPMGPTVDGGNNIYRPPPQGCIVPCFPPCVLGEQTDKRPPRGFVCLRTPRTMVRVGTAAAAGAGPVCWLRVGVVRRPLHSSIDALLPPCTGQEVWRAVHSLQQGPHPWLQAVRPAPSLANPCLWSMSSAHCHSLTLLFLHAGAR